MFTFEDQIRQLYPNIKNKIICPIITFQITEKCNLQCTYCYQKNKTYNSMTFETAKRFIQLLFQNNNYLNYKDWKGIIIEFIGGEPFIEIELMNQIMNYLYSYITKNNLLFMISITSNGTLYFNPEVQKFLQKWHNYIPLTISIDGGKKMHDSCRIDSIGQGSYDKAIAAALDWQKQTGQLPLTKITISPNNLNYLSDSIISLIQLGYNNIPINCIYENQWTLNQAQIYYKNLTQIADYIINNNLNIELSCFNPYIGRPIPKDNNRNYCGGDGRMVALKWDGNIYPCLRHMEEQEQPLIIGNVNSGIMCEQTHIENVQKLRAINRRVQSTDECYNCPIAFGCDHCLAYDYQVNKDFKRTTYTCCMHKARILANSYYWNKKWRKEKEFLRFKINMPDAEALQIVDKQELKQLKKLARLI